MMNMHLTITAIIPTFRRGPYLVNTLKSMAEQTEPADEILVLDQTPLAEHEAWVIDFLKEGHAEGKFCWIQLDEAAVSKARNQAIEVTNCDILLYLDDDIIPDPELIRLHRYHFADPAVHAVVGSVTTNRLTHFHPAPKDFRERTYVEQAFTYSNRFDSPMENIGFMCGGNFSVRRSAILAVGGWDEHIINYGDRDLGIRLNDEGYRIDYDPAATILHLAAPMGGTRLSDTTNPIKGWQRSVSLWYLAYRHLHGTMFWKYGVYRAARFSVLFKENAVRPWRGYEEIRNFEKARRIAQAWADEGLASPFI